MKSIDRKFRIAPGGRVSCPLFTNRPTFVDECSVALNYTHPEQTPGWCAVHRVRGALLLIHASKRDRRAWPAVAHAVVNAPRDHARQRASSTMHRLVVFNPTPQDRIRPAAVPCMVTSSCPGAKRPAVARHEHGFARYPDAGRLWYFMEYFFSLIEKAATLAQTMRMPPMAKGIM